MTINIIDVLIILIILLCGVIGMHRGVFKELVITVGWIVVFVVAFKLKDPLAEWFSLHLPFFQFWGVFKNVTVINIILYQFLAFLIVYSILMVLFHLVLYATGAFEKLLNITIILGIPSKILGFIVGLIEGYFLMFIVLFILSQPFWNVSIVNESKLKNTILSSTPVFGDMVSNVYDTVIEIYDLRDDYSSDSKKEEFNRESIKIMLKHHMIQVDYVQKLVDAKKIEIKGINEIIKEYR